MENQDDLATSADHEIMLDRVKGSDAATEGRRRHVFCFADGQLNVLGDGYHGKGDGWFTFDEKDVEWQPYGDRDGFYLMAKLPKSELLELRDFLNARFPPSPRPAAADPALGHTENQT